MACDGSVKCKIGTFGYVLLTDRQSEERWSGYGRVPHTENKITSQRAEYFGAAAVIILINLIKK